jgi:hypothetical protein
MFVGQNYGAHIGACERKTNAAARSCLPQVKATGHFLWREMPFQANVRDPAVQSAASERAANEIANTQRAIMELKPKLQCSASCILSNCASSERIEIAP